MSSNVTEVGIGLHGYQPPHRLKCIAQGIPFQQALRNGFQLTSELVQDPFWETKDWTREIMNECYKKAATKGLLELATWDFSISLLDYIRRFNPQLHREIIASDKKSQDRFGYGGAIIQAFYDHAIPHFETHEVKDTQIAWSVGGFREHFKRAPEGAWLPEAAVDMDTLSLLSDYGIQFIVLAPHQASRVRRLEHKGQEDKWQYVTDPSKPYKLFLPNGKDIAVFFYDAQLTVKMAHKKDGIYDSPDSFIDHISKTRQQGGTFTYNDLKTWWHHHNGSGDVFVEGLKKLENYRRFKLTNYSLFLEEHPPEDEAQIRTCTSWSCEHGLGRWGDTYRRDCTCGDVWNSEWRANLRSAFQYFNSEVEKVFFREVGPKYFNNPKAALKGYISFLQRKIGLKDFLESHMRPEISKDFETMYKLLEMMRFSMLMNTSCGWFHNGIRRIEPVMNFVAADSALKLLKELAPDGNGFSVEKHFMEMLSHVNIENNAANVFREAIEANKTPVSNPRRTGNYKKVA